MPKPPDRIALVMGLGRSGTTFLAKLIDTAPQVLYRHEPDALLPTDLPFFCDRDQISAHLPTARDYVCAMADCRLWKSNGTRPLFAKSYRSSLANLTYRMMVLSSKIGRRLHLPVGRSMPDLVQTQQHDVLYLIKSVSALGRAQLFSQAVPNMASVHIVRHPCAVYASLQSGRKKGLMRTKIRVEPLFDQPESARYPFTREEIARATFEEQVAYRWMLTNDKAAVDMANSSRYLRIGYEDLCTDIGQMTHRIFDHLNLPIGGQTRRFIDEISNPSVNGTNGVGYFDVKRSIGSAIDKWETQLEQGAVERIRAVVCHSPLGRTYFDKP